jgi:hypothetical protein
MSKIPIQEKSEVAVAIICPDPCGKHAILHINTADRRDPYGVTNYLPDLIFNVH